MSSKQILIVGAGLAGATAARELVENSNHKITVIDERAHVAGNCHTERCPDTNILQHCYGPHIFHTDRADIWHYVQQFGEWMPFTNRVKANTNRGIFSLPINLHTINQFFDRQFSPAQAQAFVASLGDKSIKAPENFEQQALAMLGPELYETFFYGYTKKQWGVEPKALPASILKRLPVRFDYNDNYYADTYQAIPKHGYTHIVENMLDHKQIEVKLNTSFDKSWLNNFSYTLFTGPIDAFFDYQFGTLGYRTVYWEKQQANGDIQGNAVINYPGLDVEYTRIHEHKHFAPWETHDQSIAFIEYAKETTSQDTPFYPKRLPQDLDKLSAYIEAGNNQSNVSFLGRLGTYRYLDMHHVIAESITFAQGFLQASNSGAAIPSFPNST